MSESFTYLRIVLSIVVGLGLTTALNALGKVIKYRKFIQTYWVAILWELGVLLMLLLHWFSTWSYQNTNDWTYPKFLLLLLPSMSLYVTSHLAFPEFHENQHYDLQKFYYRNRKYFLAQQPHTSYSMHYPRDSSSTPVGLNWTMVFGWQGCSSCL